jgi:hypothetical protein
MDVHPGQDQMPRALYATLSQASSGIIFGHHHNVCQRRYRGKGWDSVGNAEGPGEIVRGLSGGGSAGDQNARPRRRQFRFFYVIERKLTSRS